MNKELFSKATKQVLGSVLLVTQLMPSFAPTFARAAPGNQPNAKTPSVGDSTIIQDKKKALFIVSLLNRGHDLPEAQRYAPVAQMAASDIFRLICLGKEEVFTSTFLHLSDLLLKKAADEHKTIVDIADEPAAKALLPDFIETASAYGQIGKVLASVPDQASRRAFLAKAISTVADSFEKQAKEEQSMRMTVALVDTALTLQEKDVKKNFVDDIIAHYKQTKNETFRKSLGYGLSYLSDCAEMADMKKTIISAIGEDSYLIVKNEGLSEKELFKDGMQYQQMLFYNDKDGRASYAHFRETFKDWKSEQKDGFVVLSRKVKDREIIIACNEPTVEDKGIANASAYLKGKPVQVIVHRGHSYHSTKTMSVVKQNGQTACLIFWGGCGGFYNVAGTISVLTQRETPPGLILTKGEGTKYVNDRLWADLCDEMVQKGSVKWNPFWKKLSGRVSDSRFKAYVSPEKNIAAAVISSIKNFVPIRTVRANNLRAQAIMDLRAK